jgi:hypothetical protein
MVLSFLGELYSPAPLAVKDRLHALRCPVIQRPVARKEKRKMHRKVRVPPCFHSRGKKRRECRTDARETSFLFTVHGDFLFDVSKRKWGCIRSPAAQPPDNPPAPVGAPPFAQGGLWFCRYRETGRRRAPPCGVLARNFLHSIGFDDVARPIKAVAFMGAPTVLSSSAGGACLRQGFSCEKRLGRADARCRFAA